MTDQKPQEENERVASDAAEDVTSRQPITDLVHRFTRIMSEQVIKVRLPLLGLPLLGVIVVGAANAWLNWSHPDLEATAV